MAVYKGLALADVDIPTGRGIKQSKNRASPPSRRPWRGEQEQEQPTWMTFESFVALYTTDMQGRVKETPGNQGAYYPAPAAPLLRQAEGGGNQSRKSWRGRTR